MIGLVLRRAAAQLPLLAAVLAVVTIGATLLGVCALLVTATQQRALDAELARAGPAAVDVTAFVGGVRAGAGGAVAAAAREVVTGAVAPLPATTSTRASSALRTLGPQREGARRLAYLAGVDGLPGRGRLVAGRWPVAGAPVTEAAVLTTTADVLGLAPGRTVRLGPSPAAPGTVTVRVVGVFRPLPDAGWDRDPLRAAGYDPGYQDPVPATAYGPFMVDLADLLAGGAALDRLQVTAHPTVDADRAGAAVASLAGDNGRLTAALGDRVQLSRVASELPATLAAARAQQAVTRATVLVVVLLGTALTATVLGLAGRLVAALRSPESAVLASYGASRRQLVALAGVEAGLLAAVAAVLAVPLSGVLHSVLTHRPGPAAAGLAAAPGVTVAQVVAVVAGAVVLAAVLVLPVLRRSSTVDGRAAGPSLLARSGADLVLAGLAAVGWWQLAEQPAAATGPDAVRVLAPVLVLVAGAALVLRAVAVPLALAERGARRARSLVLPLAAFEAARRPRVVAASLLLTLAAAAGTFGLAFGATWERSQRDQADVRVGTDLALTLVGPAAAGQGTAVAAATGGVVSPVTSRPVVVGEVVGGVSPRLVAVDTTRAGALLRGRSAAGWDRVAAPLAPSSPVTGLPVPAGSPALTLTGTLAAGTRVTPRLVLQDRSGLRTACAAEAVALDGRAHRLRLCRPLLPGLRLVGVDLRVESATVPAEESTAPLAVSLGVPGAAGAQDWSATSVGLTPSGLTGPAAAVRGGVVRTTGTVKLAGLAYEPVEVVATAFRPPGPVPVAVSRRFAAGLGVGTGDLLSVTVGSTPVGMTVTEVVPAVPSVPAGPALLADADLLSRALISTGLLEPAVDAWWVGSPAAPAAAARLGIGGVVTRAGVREELAAGPLSVGLPTALTLLVPAAVLLALAGTVLDVTASVDRRAVARLRGLGQSRRGILGGLLAQHGGLLVLLLGAGGLVGVLAARVIAPLLVRSETGAAPVPAALADRPWAAEGALLAVLLGTCAAATALVLVLRVRRADPTDLRTTT